MSQEHRCDLRRSSSPRCPKPPANWAPGSLANIVNTAACLLALALSGPLAAVLPSGATLAQSKTAVAQTVAQTTPAPTTSLTATQANEAARTLLEAIKAKDGQAIYQGLSDPLRNSTTTEAVQQRMNRSPKVSSYRISEISRGIDDTTVEAFAVVETRKGEVPLLLVLDDSGKLVAWKWVGTTLPIETTALKFVNDLKAGRWIAARYYLDLDFQKELSPQDLQRKWTKLSRTLGGVQTIKSALVASQGGEQQLVLVTIQFGKVTDNLFVIFNRQGRIINVDFSSDLV
ncbi:MAG: hypothetical protein RLZZ216_1972 [Cyanobacteriota bacterium]